MPELRSRLSSDREGPVLSLVLIEEKVELQQALQYIPSETRKQLQESVCLVDGKDIKDLTIDERKLVEIIVTMGNDYLISAILCGEYRNKLWTPDLRTAVVSHQKKVMYQSLECIRNENREHRRSWCEKIRRAVSSLSPSGST